MSNSRAAMLSLLLIITIIAPSISYSKQHSRRDMRQGHNLYSDDDFAYSPVDTSEGQIFLGAIDIVASTYLFKSAFSLPNAIKLKQEMVYIAAQYDLKKIELQTSKALVTTEEVKAKINRVSKSVKGLSGQKLSPSDFQEMKEHFIKRELNIGHDEYSDLKKKLNAGEFTSKAKKQSLVNGFEKQLASIAKVQESQKLSFGKILGDNGIKVRALKLVGGVFFVLDLLNRVIVWNLLDDFPGYILDIDDIKSIGFNLFGIGEWEIGKDDGSRAREL